MNEENPANAQPQATIASLQLIIQDLKLHLKAKQEAAKNG